MEFKRDSAPVESGKVLIVFTDFTRRQLLPKVIDYSSFGALK